MRSNLFLIWCIFAISIGCKDRVPSKSGHDTSGHSIHAFNEPLETGQKTWAIVHANIIVGDGHTTIDNGTVVIEEDKISAVGVYGEVEIGSHVETYDATGLTLLPGLIDAHFHLDRHKKNLPAHFIRRGVTSIRDPGAWIEDYDSVRLNTRILSRLFLTGPHLDMFPPAYPKNSFILRNELDAKLATQKFIAQGASAIKVYFRSTLPIIEAVCQTADQFGVPVTAHLEITDIYEAVKLGLDGIEHITSLGYNLVPAQYAEAYKQAILKDNNARRAGRYSMWEEINPKSDIAQDMAAMLAAKEVFVCPTLGAFEYQGDSSFTDSLRFNAFQHMLQYTEVLHKAGVAVVIGSHGWVQHDAFGWSFHHEMELFQKANIPPLKIIQAGTSDNARFLNIDDRLGTVETGKLADLILVEGNPEKDVADLRNIKATILNGIMLN